MTSSSQKALFHHLHPYFSPSMAHSFQDLQDYNIEPCQFQHKSPPAQFLEADDSSVSSDLESDNDSELSNNSNMDIDDYSDSSYSMFSDADEGCDSQPSSSTPSLTSIPSLSKSQTPNLCSTFSFRKTLKPVSQFSPLPSELQTPATESLVSLDSYFCNSSQIPTKKSTSCSSPPLSNTSIFASKPCLSYTENINSTKSCINLSSSSSFESNNNNSFEMKSSVPSKQPLLNNPFAFSPTNNTHSAFSPSKPSSPTSTTPTTTTTTSWAMPSFNNGEQAGFDSPTSLPFVPMRTPRFPRNCKVRRTQSMFESPEKYMSQELNSPLSKVQPTVALSKETATAVVVPPVAASSSPKLHIQTSILNRPDCPLKTFNLPKQDDQFKRIDRDTLCNVIDGHYNHVYSRHVIIDCRFEYEYDGGHIDGAINVNTKESLEKVFAANFNLPQLAANENVLLIFHCEYSAHRGPRMAMHLRNLDRHANISNYPHLSFPDIVILEGGYSKFFNSHFTRCFPQKYVAMNDDKVACEKNMDKFRRAMRTTSTASFSSSSSSSSTTSSDLNIGFKFPPTNNSPSSSSLRSKKTNSCIEFSSCSPLSFNTSYYNNNDNTPTNANRANTLLSTPTTTFGSLYADNDPFAFSNDGDDTPTAMTTNNNSKFNDYYYNQDSSPLSCATSTNNNRFMFGGQRRLGVAKRL